MFGPEFMVEGSLNGDTFSNLLQECLDPMMDALNGRRDPEELTARSTDFTPLDLFL